MGLLYKAKMQGPKVQNFQNGDHGALIQALALLSAGSCAVVQVVHHEAHPASKISQNSRGHTSSLQKKSTKAKDMECLSCGTHGFRSCYLFDGLLLLSASVQPPCPQVCFLWEGLSLAVNCVTLSGVHCAFHSPSPACQTVGKQSCVTW